VLAVLLGSAGCTLLERGSEPPSERVAVPLDDEVRDLLTRRAGAVRAGDLSAFLADVAPGGAAFRRRQQRYFLNLRELPLATFGYLLTGDGAALDRQGRVRAEARLRMRLDGYDAHPVVTPVLFTFVRGRDGALRLVSDRNRAFTRAHDVEAAPWDLTRIEVEEGDGVLGIFDGSSVDAAYQLVPSVERAIAAVSAEVPLRWSESVVLYALSDVRVLADLDNLPGGDPDQLDGVTFPVAGGREGRRLAGTRFMLHPRMLRGDADRASRDRLIRHELTHVALGRRDDRVPTWLSEGIAEYVSVQPIPHHDRRISQDALRAARSGLSGLPKGATFNGPQSGANYGISWFACEHIVDVYGEEALWRLFDAMRQGGGTAEDEQDRVLREELGISGAELARAAGRRIVNTFG